MRASTLLVALPALAAAQQIPFLDQVKGFFAKASESITSAASSVSVPSISLPNPVASGAAKIASLKVVNLDQNNYKDLLKPGAATASPGIEEWMIMVTGGNKTCYGACQRAEQAWNESVALLSASKSPPQLGLLDCEKNAVLCNAWAAGPPTILHFLIPQPLADQSTPATTCRSIRLNRTSITSPEIAAIHLQEKYKETEPYAGLFHPFDGLLAQNGVAIPVGYLIWGFSLIPSWAFMIIVSFASRTLM